jgi:LacI family transcriptional regulator
MLRALDSATVPAMSPKPRARARRLTNDRATVIRPTIREVASAAGVSTATVSNVINGVASAASAETRRLVQAQIARLGYRPQIIGRGLRTSRRYAIAIVVIDESEDFLRDPFVATVTAGLAQTLNARGYSTVLHGSRHDQFAQAAVVRQFSVDGYCAILAGTRNQRNAVLKRLEALRQPIVIVQDDHYEPGRGACSILQDDASGGRLIGRHLCSLCKGRYLFVMPRLEWPALNARIAGVRESLRKSGEVTLDVLRTSSEHFSDVCAEVATHLRLNGPPAAILAANDQIGLAALRALQDAKLRVPQDVKVTGFNALELWQYSHPRLTTIVSPAYELGVAAAVALLTRIETGRFASRRVVLPVELRVSESTVAEVGASPEP